MTAVAGTIYLGGGGSADDEARVWQAMLEGKRHIVHWPFASPPAQRRATGDWLVRALRDLGLDVDTDTWTDLAGRTADDLHGADLLFVSGGNTFDLLAHVREHGFEQAARDFVAGGGDYYGGSAGALLAGADITIATPYDPNDVGLTDLTALGLVPGVEVLPHYTPEHADEGRDRADASGNVVLGIPERSGVAVRDGLAQVIGFEPVAVFGPGGDAVREPGETWPLPTLP